MIQVRNMHKVRKYGLDQHTKDVLQYLLKFGPWKSIMEYGDRDGAEEPCVMAPNPGIPINGYLCYQAAWVLHHEEAVPKGHYISHRCRSIRCKKTACCNVSHMLLKDRKVKAQKDDSSERQKDHNKISTKGNQMMAKGTGPSKGPLTTDECIHGDDCCFINFGKNKVVGCRSLGQQSSRLPLIGSAK